MEWAFTNEFVPHQDGKILIYSISTIVYLSIYTPIYICPEERNNKAIALRLKSTARFQTATATGSAPPSLVPRPL